MSADPDFHWCPMPDCGSGQYSSGNIFTCAECEVKSCVHCAVEWHEEETCDDYQRRVKSRPEEEEASELGVSKISKPCPGCKAKIAKTEFVHPRGVHEYMLKFVAAVTT